MLLGVCYTVSFIASLIRGHGLEFRHVWRTECSSLSCVTKQLWHTLCMCASPTNKENYFFNGALQHFLNKFRKWYWSFAQAPPVKMWAKCHFTARTREFAMVSNSTAESAHFSFNKWHHWGHWLINSNGWFHGHRRIIYALFVRIEFNKKENVHIFHFTFIS